MSKRSSSVSHFWQKHVPAHQGDEWMERLAYLPSDRLILLQAVSGKTASIEYYPERVSEIKKLIHQFGGSARSVSREKWVNSQKRRFELPVKPYFCIAADRDSISPKNKKLPAILIPASIAFGTGEHATTAMCLHAIARLSHAYPKGTMLDVGTGSGILALAGALLGLRVEAIDLDPDCIHESKANAARNDFIPKVAWKLQPVEKFSGSKKFDLIVGNLYSECIIAALPRLKRHLKKGGAMVLSGILKTQCKDVLSKIEQMKLTPQSVKTRGKWVCVTVSA